MKKQCLLLMILVTTTVLLHSGMCESCPPDGTINKNYMREQFHGNKSVKINGCGVHTIVQDAFSDGSSITYLDLRWNKLTHIPDHVFANMSSLDTVVLSSNEISSISNQMFTGLQKLRGLTLYNNTLTQIPDGVFGQLSSLEHLNLGRTELRNISPKIFIGLHNLQWLYLYTNKLTEIPDGAFSNLSSLVVLSLDTNEISYISVKSFTGLHNLQELRLSGNRISQIADGAFLELGQLRYLNFRHNKISNISRCTFSGLKNATEINLCNNQISYIDDFAFSELQNFKKLCLDSTTVANVANVSGLKVNKINTCITPSQSTESSELTLTDSENMTIIVGTKDIATTVGTIIQNTVTTLGASSQNKTNIQNEGAPLHYVISLTVTGSVCILLIIAGTLLIRKIRSKRSHFKEDHNMASSTQSQAAESKFSMAQLSVQNFNGYENSGFSETELSRDTCKYENVNRTIDTSQYENSMFAETARYDLRNANGTDGGSMRHDEENNYENIPVYLEIVH